jgi:two-component system chemotaxis response regulator CheB
MKSEGRVARAKEIEKRRFDAIVIGGSAGVLEVLRDVLAALPHTLSIPVLIVVHLPPRSHSQVYETLQSVTQLPMSQAEDKEPLLPGRIYFAPAGYHLLVEADRCAALSIDEPVFYSRPSIDVLFESSCDVYRDALLGILLTGASPDGAAGLHCIHAHGGVTVVQRPDTCEATTMPQAALDLFEPDYVLAPREIAALLSALTSSSKMHSHD